MGKLILAALFGGLVSAVLTFFLMATLRNDTRLEELEKRAAAVEEGQRSQESMNDIVSRRVESLTRQWTSAARDQAREVARLEEAIAARPAAATSEGGGEAPAPGATAPDGTAYVSRKELDAALAKARTAGQLPADWKPVEKKSLEDIARDMNLSSSEEAQARTILRDSEQELVTCLFGDRPFSEIAVEVKAAKEDPEKMQQMVGDAVGRAFANIGKLMTIETRSKKRLADAIGKDKAKDLWSRPRKPILGEEWESLFKDLDLD